MQGSDESDAREEDTLDASASSQEDASEVQDDETAPHSLDAPVLVDAGAVAPAPESDTRSADDQRPLSRDAGMDDVRPLSSEAGVDADMASADAGLCSSKDLDAWRRMHLRSDVRERITQCRIDCDNEVMCVDRCLRRVAGIAECDPCTRAESLCSSRFCNYACLASRTDQICLSCLCQADCVGSFEGCAGDELGLCTPELFAYGPSAGQTPLDSPALLIGKSTTGALASAKFDGASELLTDELTSIHHFPTGFAQFVAVSLADRELVLHYNVNCNAMPCVVRGYPILRDGSFAAPVFEERWEGGFLDVETFGRQGQRYLVRMHAHVDALNAENISIDRFDWDVEEQRLRRRSELRSRVSSSGSHNYSEVEPLTIGDQTFLFLLAPQQGEGVFMRVEFGPSGMELTRASDTFYWSPGWDLVETFKSFGRWYLLASKSGRIAFEQEPAGQTRIWLPRLSSRGMVSLDAPVLDEVWGAGVTHVLSFTDASGRARVLLNLEALGRLRLHVLEEESTRWHDNFMTPHQEQFRGRVPPWDVLAIVRDGKW